MSGWSSGLCGCLEHKPSCIDTWCCPICQVGFQGNAAEGNPGSCCGIACIASMCGFLTICACCIRMKVSEKYGLGESCIASLCFAWCCPHCSICQTHRELRYRGVPPGGICVAILEKGEAAAGGAIAGGIPGQAQGSPDWELWHNEELTQNTELNSQNGSYKLIHQSDGNVVLYHGDKATWATNTCGKSTAKFIMQSDGNVVLYGPSNEVHWASNTCNSGAKKLVVQDDGNLVLYGDNGSVAWASGTNGQ